MKTVRIEKFGPPSLVAKCVQRQETLVPSAWEVVVKVKAFPLNPADLAILSGNYGILPKLPASVGMEGAGEVVQCGESVDNFQPGDRVMIIANDNWSEYRKVPANLLYKIPEAMDLLTAATMKVNFATAYLLLHNFQTLKPNQWIVQNAPLSNVGRLVIQMANSLGIKTVNLVRRVSAIEEVLQLGGDVAVASDDEFVRRVTEKIGKAKIKLGLDAVGGGSTQQLATLCADKSPLVTYGMLSNEPCQLHPEDLIFRGIQHQGFWLSKRLNRMSHQERQDLYDRVTEMVLKHSIEPKFDAAFDLTQINEALQFYEQGKGKAIVFPHGVPETSALATRLIARQAALRQDEALAANRVSS